MTLCKLTKKYVDKLPTNKDAGYRTTYNGIFLCNS